MMVKIVSWAAIYCMIWWVTLFAVLPLAGHRSAHESGEATIPGNDPGAPVKLNLWKTVKINTLIAFVIWAVVLVLNVFVHIPLPKIPG
ncbi:MAG: DUF1467 family protein [Asticcacaulis sp.]